MPPPLPHRARRLARQACDDAGYALQLRVLPPRVAVAQLRARAHARRGGDAFSLASATRPADLASLLALAHGRRYVAELGTGTAWTAIALAIADPQREIISFDPVNRIERSEYLALVRPPVRARIEFVQAPGAIGPRSARPVEMLYVDSSHRREDTVAELGAWTSALAPGALVVLDDYGHPDYPGVKQAVQELGLPGEQRGTLFVHRRSR
jgi:predicted O-methyltransferase YrrM